MTARTRIFTTAYLTAIGLPFDCGAFDGAATKLADEQIDTRRWVEVRQIIFRAPDDGRAYSVTYAVGLTECQEDTDPWDGETVTAVEMEERQVTVTKWLPVEDEAPLTAGDAR